MSDLDFEIINGCDICGDLGHNAWECPNQTQKFKLDNSDFKPEDDWDNLQ